MQLAVTALKASKLNSAVLNYSSDSRRRNIARGKKANKQISLADQGLVRSFHLSRAIFQESLLFEIRF